MGTARHGLGTNQYQTRLAGPKLATSRADLMVAAGAQPQQLPCGQVWGTRCRTLVQAPSWSHGTHPSRAALDRALNNPGTHPAALEHIVRAGLRAAEHPMSYGTWRMLLVTHRTDAIIHPNCPTGLLIELSQHPNHYVRADVATNPGCPPDVLRHLAGDAHWDVRERVAHNLSSPADTLVTLLQDTVSSVQRTAAENPRLPRHARAMWQLTHR